MDPQAERAHENGNIPSSSSPMLPQQSTAGNYIENLQKSFRKFRTAAVIVSVVCLAARILLSLFSTQIFTSIMTSSISAFFFIQMGGQLSAILIVPPTVLIIIALIKYIRYKSTLPNQSQDFRRAFVLSRRIMLILLAPAILLYAVAFVNFTGKITPTLIDIKFDLWYYISIICKTLHKIQAELEVGCSCHKTRHAGRLFLLNGARA